MAYERSFGLGISIGVRTKLVLSTAAILIVACLLLGCLFFRQQVRSATESLVQSGALLAQHLAGMGRVSILAGDTHRLDQLAQEILAVNPVAYVAILSSNGDLHTGYGKGEWQQQFSASSTNRRQFSVTKLVSQPKADAGESIINGIWLSRNGPLLRSSLDFSPSELLNLLGGYELPIFYDLLVQVPRQSHTNQRDPALELTLKERPRTP